MKTFLQVEFFNRKMSNCTFKKIIVIKSWILAPQCITAGLCNTFSTTNSTSSEIADHWGGEFMATITAILSPHESSHRCSTYFFRPTSNPFKA